MVRQGLRLSLVIGSYKLCCEFGWGQWLCFIIREADGCVLLLVELADLDLCLAPPISCSWMQLETATD